MDAITARLEEFPAGLAPLAGAARRLLNKPGGPSVGGVVRLGHRPWVARENYAVTLYPGLSRDALARYAQRFRLIIPDVYAEFLATVNGAFCFGMGLAGVPGSMLGEPPLLDRTRLQCHDLGGYAAHTTLEYRKLPAGAFHFGYRHYSYRENIGYFIDGSRFLSIRKTGRIIGDWGTFHDFLQDELLASEKLDEELHPPPAGS